MSSKAPRPGVVETLEPGVRRVLAPNPSPMTYWGTNTYILGEGDVAVVDPGPANTTHLDAVQDGLVRGEKISAILVTHAHLDHSPGARPLSQATGAPIYAYGDSTAGRSEVMARLSQEGLTGGGEGVDSSFWPDERLGDGDVLTVGGAEISALWTPGHMANHLSFAIGDALFSGDLIMGWASTLVSPPDGDLTAFMASAARIEARGDRICYPGHGTPIEDPKARAAWLISHRQGREAQMLDALGEVPRSIPALTQEIYTDVAPELLPAAERNVFAHLIDLHGRGLVGALPTLSHNANYFRHSPD